MREIFDWQSRLFEVMDLYLPLHVLYIPNSYRFSIIELADLLQETLDRVPEILVLLISQVVKPCDLSFLLCKKSFRISPLVVNPAN